MQERESQRDSVCVRVRVHVGVCVCVSEHKAKERKIICAFPFRGLLLF